MAKGFLLPSQNSVKMFLKNILIKRANIKKDILNILNPRASLSIFFFWESPPPFSLLGYYTTQLQYIGVGGGGAPWALRAWFSKGVWGHALPEMFENLSL